MELLEGDRGRRYGGKCWMLLKELYGTRDDSQSWERELEDFERLD